MAEGVETFEELAYLQAATRIRHAQGYYFSKPFFLDDLKHARELDPEVRDLAPARPLARAATVRARAGGAVGLRSSSAQQDARRLRPLAFARKIGDG